MATKRGKLLTCIFDADMRNGHDGLAALAKENGIDVKKLEPGEYVAFVNSARTKLKVYAANRVVAYHKPAAERNKIDMHTLALIPQVFQGGDMNYEAALKKTLTKRLSTAVVEAATEEKEETRTLRRAPKGAVQGSMSAHQQGRQ